MKKTLIALTAIACFSSVAYAENSGVYLGGQLGVSILKAKSLQDKWKYDDGDEVDTETFKTGSISKGKFAGALNLGYNFKYDYAIPVRAELSFTLRGNLDKEKNKSIIDEDGDVLHSKERTKARMNTLMVNGYYDIETGTAFTPFVGAGLGVAFAKLDHKYSEKYDFDNEEDYIQFSKSKTKFAWNVAAGVAYNVADNLDIDFTARYVDAGKLSIKRNVDEELSVKASGKLSSVDLLAGIRYSF